MTHPDLLHHTLPLQRGEGRWLQAGRGLQMVVQHGSVCCRGAPQWPAYPGPAQRLASVRLAGFNEAKIEDIFQSGLHEYIQRFLADNNALAAAVHEQYLV